MVPTRNLLRRHYETYGEYISDSYFMNRSLREEGRPEEEEEPGTSSRESGDHSYEGWLQLGVGMNRSPARRPASSEVMAGAFTPRPWPQSPAPAPAIPLFPPQTPPHFGVFNPRGTPWGLWNASAPARSFMMPFESSSVSSDELRLVSPPVRPSAGVWFSLKALKNQRREPCLPQIPKSYLRIKNGGMTVMVLKKYLVYKLGLEDESEIEISCRGQPLLPIFTIQHVYIHIWKVSEASTSLQLLPESPCDDHLMTLQYGRS